jgi:GTPase
LVSNVTGLGIPYLRQFLNILPMKPNYESSKPAEFQITEIFSVPGVGTVVSGTLISGTVAPGDTLLLGPDSFGEFMPAQIKGIHIKRVSVAYASAGHTVTLALKKIKKSQLRKGMVLVSKDLQPQACYEFEAEIKILFHSTTIHLKYQAMMHTGNIRQTVALVNMDRDVLRSGDRAVIRFRFMSRPEYLKEGAKVLFRERRTKAVGQVCKVYSIKECGPKIQDSRQKSQRSLNSTKPLTS